ncbi:MAG TPA: YncE family protein [Verrucomicrobiae bacterium]|nr:YncE family protein [Verrucomicrobiae bacterium]
MAFLSWDICAPTRNFQIIKTIGLFVLSSAMLISGRAQETNTLLTLDKTIPLPKVEGRIDHMAVDVARQRLFISALGNNTVEVVDLKAGKQIQSLSGFAEPQGIVYVPEFDRLFVANGADGTCRILDGQSFETIGTVELGDDADNVRYDETAKKVYVGYGSGALAAIDAKTGAKVADIKLAAHPESFRLETDNARIFVNVPGVDQIVVIDSKKGAVVNSWPLKEAKSNFPLILDEANHRLFVGCRSPSTVLVYDSASGRLVANIPIARDTDDLFYDVRNRLLYVSCGKGSIEIIRQNNADNYQKLGTLSTAPGARTSLFIPELNLFCLAVPHRGIQPAEIRVFQSQK